MKNLTELEAVSHSIKLWQHLAETGKEEEGDFALCTYAIQQCQIPYGIVCSYCPYYETFGKVCTQDDEPYMLWYRCDSTNGKKLYARHFLYKLYQIFHLITSHSCPIG